MSDPLDEWREIIAKTMREDDPDVTEEQIRETQDRATGSVVGAKVTDRRGDRERSIRARGATAPVTRDRAEAEALVRRRLTPTPGRPPGRRSSVRAALVAEVAARPDMPSEEIDRRGVDRGAWLDAQGDPETIRKRVARIRRDASAGQ